MSNGLTNEQQLACPSFEELEAFVHGLVPDARIDEIGEHIDQCTACRDIVRASAQVEDSMAGFMAAVAELSATKSHIDGGLDHSPKTHDSVKTSLIEIGSKVGPYTVLEELGRGGMGTVYLVRHELLEKQFALKLLSRKRSDSPVMRKFFSKEMRTLGQVNHPGIAQATDAGDFDGVPYLVMEYVEGFNFSQLLGRLGPLPLADACEAVRQVAETLQSASEIGVVHRDIKPLNLMLTPAGAVKLLDFGLAALDDAPDPNSIDLDEDTVTSLADVTANDVSSQHGLIVGTAHYMSPEQARGKTRLDVRSDIYSLGCTLFKLIMGRAPFAYEQEGSTSLSTRRQILAAQVTREAPQIEVDGDQRGRDAVQTIISRCLQKHPKHRYQTPGELAADLAPLAKGSSLAKLAETAKSPSEKRPIGRPKPRPEVRKSGRKRVVIGLATAITVLAVAFGLWLKLRDGDPAQVHVISDEDDSLVRLRHGVKGDWKATVTITRSNWNAGFAGIFYGFVPYKSESNSAVVFEVIDIAPPPEGSTGFQVRRRQFQCENGDATLRIGRTIATQLVPLELDASHTVTISTKDDDIAFVAVDGYACPRLILPLRKPQWLPIWTYGDCGLVSMLGTSQFTISEFPESSEKGISE